MNLKSAFVYLGVLHQYQLDKTIWRRIRWNGLKMKWKILFLTKKQCGRSFHRHIINRLINGELNPSCCDLFLLVTATKYWQLNWEDLFTLPAWMPECLPAWMPACLPACLNAWMSACLPACLNAWMPYLCPLLPLMFCWSGFLWTNLPWSIYFY